MYSGGSNSSAAQLRADQRQREEALRQGKTAVDKQFEGFTPGFFDARANAYQQFALPTLANEYSRSRRALGYSLADRGLFNSSAANEARAGLESSMSGAKRNIADEGIRQANTLRGDVEGQRTTLLNQLYATQDPSLAQSQATRAAQQFSAPPTFAPVGGFLNDWSNIYLTKQMADAYAPASQQQNKGFSFGAPAPKTSTSVGFR